jgi:hypothetical protein
MRRSGDEDEQILMEIAGAAAAERRPEKPREVTL